MENLDALLFVDWVAIVGGIALANAVTLAVFVLVGLSHVPEMGLLGLLGAFLLVVVGLTVLPAVSVLGLIFLAGR